MLRYLLLATVDLSNLSTNSLGLNQVNKHPTVLATAVIWHHVYILECRTTQ